MDHRDKPGGDGGQGNDDQSEGLTADLILSLSKDEVVALPAFPASWFDKLTMRSS